MIDNNLNLNIKALILNKFFSYLAADESFPKHLLQNKKNLKLKNKTSKPLIDRQL